jgi:hypothetical protein
MPSMPGMRLIEKPADGVMTYCPNTPAPDASSRASCARLAGRDGHPRAGAERVRQLLDAKLIRMLVISTH